MRAVSPLLGTRFCPVAKTRSHECERGTHECVRHIGDNQNMRLTVFAFAFALAFASEPSEELRKAVRGGDVAHARELLQQGVAVNGANDLGGTPLHHAAWSSAAGMVQLLLSFPSDW